MKMASQTMVTWLLFLILLFHESEQTVFLSAQHANKVMQRTKRANFMLIEEILPGSLERECLEEMCVYEEAREHFEDKPKTDMFWKTYYGGKKCSSSPCLNSGACTDTIRSYKCSCADGYSGSVCQFAKNECHPQNPDGCQHFCTPGVHTFHCSCAPGYDLGTDDKSCIPTDPYACGRVLVPEGDVQKKTRTENQMLQTGFPWQVMLIEGEGNGFCSGAILNSNFVLTTAQCTHMYSNFKVAAGRIGMSGELQLRRRIWRLHLAGGDKHNCRGKVRMKASDHNMKLVPVHQVHTHVRYSKETGENNIALLQLSNPLQYSKSCLPICLPEKDFAEHVLIPAEAGTVSGWKLQEEADLNTPLLQFQVSYLPKETCEAMLNITHTNRRFCMHAQELINSTLAGGSIFATEHNRTWFLTGIMGSWSMEGSHPNVLLFTKISRYVNWLQQIMN